MRRFTILTVALTAAVAFLVGLLLAGQFSTPVVTTAPKPAPRANTAAAPVSIGNGAANFADVAEKVNAAVVNIDATSKGSALRDSQRFFRRPPGDPREAPGGAGSGFIIDREGFILTNYHVIESTERITVTLADGRAFRAEVVGTDPAIDVALLKISGDRDFPEVSLGNSDELRVGEWVCAIGNPLGYVHSVTVGVVSFIGRKLFDASLDDYIQTDAAINFGNSGGPLINTRGEVIGINSAISSQKGSSISFAVPINKATAVLPQLKASGRVSRGYMGVLLTDVTVPLQRALGLQVARGALVQDVSADSPAQRSGIRVYDVIVEVEGRDIGSNDDLIRDISSRQPGSIARVHIVRDGRRLTLPVRLTERPPLTRTSDDTSEPLPGGRGVRPPPEVPETPLGITVREIDRGVLGRLQVPDTVEGVMVARVDPTGAAFSAQVRRGFIILEINRKPVRSMADYQRIVGAARPGDVLAILYFDPTVAQRAVLTVTVE